ncbi:MAG: TetR/AcrR family transcriptional regulator [Candidatus Aegiribacteria sp.]|nr:TetR/AcrR family transcriptional regulator [Candidatus Aegiribacteria sp.]
MQRWAIPRSHSLMGRRKLIDDEALLVIARDVFIEEGFGASTRRIADLAGISEAAIYKRYATKADLFYSSLVPPTLDLDAILGAGDECLGTLEHLMQVAFSMLEYFREIVPILKPLANHPEFNFEEFARRHPETPLHRLRMGLIELLRELQDRSEITDLPTEPVAMTLFASMYSLATLELLGAHGGRFEDKLIKGMVETLWRGIKP